MLSSNEYYKQFFKIQNDLKKAFSRITSELKIGNSEKDIAESIEKELKSHGYSDFWYPTLVYIGQSTSNPISRRYHLPSSDIVLNENDIICIDVTPINNTVWGNWCQTLSVGNDLFFKTLCSDCKEVTENLCTYSIIYKDSKTFGDLYSYFQKLSIEKETELHAPYNSIGHSIFQVPQNSKVENANVKDRIQINEDFFSFSLNSIDILSIEPQLARVNPHNGILYSAKQQGIIYISRSIIYEMD